ncbi:hypothetical protein EBME_0175 [bacterium endosymbiont of Mortierella elongata FMR23-6]|nr:hypothetical protein EBME_0175 [bacterium endosymbiont of Mortierella elongata FMR23-6]
MRFLSKRNCTKRIDLLIFAPENTKIPHKIKITYHEMQTDRSY